MRKALPVFWCVDERTRRKLDPKPTPKLEWVDWKQEISHRPYSSGRIK